MTDVKTKMFLERAFDEAQRGRFEYTSYGPVQQPDAVIELDAEAGWLAFEAAVRDWRNQ